MQKQHPVNISAINGASGGVGTFAIQIAKILGAKVTAVSSNKNKDICLGLGADIHLDYNSFSFEKLNAKYDVFFDVFGNKNWRKIKHLLPNNGWYISTVPNAKNIGDTLLSYLKIKKSRLIVVESHCDDLKLLKEWLENGKLKPVIEKEYPITEIKEVHKRLETKESGGENSSEGDMMFFL